MIIAEKSLIVLKGRSIVSDVLRPPIKGDDRYTPFESCYKDICRIGEKKPGFNYQDFVDYLDSESVDFNPSAVNISDDEAFDDESLYQDEDDFDNEDYQLDMDINKESDIDDDKLTNKLENIKNGKSKVLKFLVGKMRHYLVDRRYIEMSNGHNMGLAKNGLDSEDGEEVRAIDLETFAVGRRNINEDIYVNDLRNIVSCMIDYSIKVKWNVLQFAIVARNAIESTNANANGMRSGSLWDAYITKVKRTTIGGPIENKSQPRTSRSKDGEFREFRDSFLDEFADVGNGFVIYNRNGCEPHIIMAKAFYILCDRLDIDLTQINLNESKNYDLGEIQKIIDSKIDHYLFDNEISIYYGVKDIADVNDSVNESFNKLMKLIECNINSSFINYNTIDPMKGDVLGVIDVPTPILAIISDILYKAFEYKEKELYYRGDISKGALSNGVRTERDIDYKSVAFCGTLLMNLMYRASDASGNFEDFNEDFMYEHGLNYSDFGFISTYTYSQHIICKTYFLGEIGYLMIHETGIIVKLVANNPNEFKWAFAEDLWRSMEENGRDYNAALSSTKWYMSSRLLY